MRRAVSVSFVWALLTSHVAADERLAMASASDEIALARVAEELGDPELLARLSGAGPRAERLVAIRASLHARAPEALVPALASIACGRDPALAPEAAFVLLRLVELLHPSDLALREVLKSDLGKAREALACAGSEPRPRADIGLALAHLAAALDRLVRE